MPSLDERLDRLADVRKEAEAALQLSKEWMKEQFERNKRSAHVFNVGDMVWLTAKDIKIHQKTPKLGPRLSWNTAYTLYFIPFFSYFYPFY
jgi:hypothetical protein